VVGPEEPFEPVGLGSAGDRNLVRVAHALLGLGHEDEAHGPSTVATILQPTNFRIETKFGLDRMINR